MPNKILGKCISRAIEEVIDLHHRLERKGYIQVDKYLFFYDYGEDLLKASAEASLPR